MQVELADARTYQISVGSDLYKDLGGAGAARPDSSAGNGVQPTGSQPPANFARVVVISDTNVAPLYLDEVLAAFEGTAAEVSSIVVEAGESAKRIEIAAELWSRLAQLKLGRDGLIVALGGGVVGDLGGFVASTYMRGVACLQLPTTLLAMVDSSIGGKTAINLPEGKNLVGTFTQPLRVVCNLDVLATLPAREWLCGMAEVAKSALLDGENFTKLLEWRAKDFADRDSAVTQELIERSLEFKARVVGQDELEHGLRECLNYGHTLAHALETVAGYGVLSHGQAVAEGMRFAAELGRSVAGVSDGFIARQAALLDSLGLAKLQLCMDPQELLDVMAADKKVRDGAVRFIFTTAPGQWQSSVVDSAVIAQTVRDWIA